MKQLEGFVHNNNLFDPFQSAYRAQHATETAILKINNDILSGLDRGRCNGLHHASPIEHIKSALITLYQNPSLYDVVCLKDQYLTLDYIVCKFIYYL